MPDRGERLSHEAGRHDEYEYYETGSDYAGTLEKMAAMDLAPPSGIDDVYTPNQLLARILQDGEEGYRQTVDEHQTLSDSRNDRRTAAYYDVAISMVNAIRKLAEAEGRAGNWRDGLNEHLVIALSLENYGDRDDKVQPGS